MAGAKKCLGVFVAAVAIALVAAPACSSSTHSDPLAARELHAALERTMATNFHFDATVTGGQAQSGDFQAPNRLRVVAIHKFPGPKGSITVDASGNILAPPPPSIDAIIVENHRFMAALGQPGKYYRMPHSLAEGFVPFERPLRSDAVTRHGSDYVVAFRHGYRATARVHGGRIAFVAVSVRDAKRTFRYTYSLSHFGDSLDIQPPAADTIVPFPPRTPSPAPTVDPGPKVGLPKTHVIFTTLQFRAVTGDAGSTCTAKTPAPAKAARLPSLEGDACFVTGPALLSLKHIDATARFGDTSGAWYVQLKLNRDDSDRFDAMAKDHLGQQIALVAYGYVLSAPTINATSFDGRPTISGDFTEQFAKQLAAAIRGDS